jgi:hypothetical protein
VKELHAMEDAGKTSHHVALGRSYDLLVTRGAAGTIESGAAGGKDMKGAMERYAESVNRHQETWSRLLNRVPEEQRGAFMRALETSRRGPEDAQRAHQQGLKLLMERRLREKGRPLPPKPPQKPDGKKSMVPEERWTPRNADSRRHGRSKPAGFHPPPPPNLMLF